jgi:hypothetical protein
VNRECFFHALFQAVRGAGIDPFQFPMDLIQRSTGVGLCRHRVSRDQLPLDSRLVLFRQLVQNIPSFMDLATLHHGSFPRMSLHRRRQSLRAIQDVQPRSGKIQPAARQVLQQLAHDRGRLNYVGFKKERQPESIPVHDVDRAITGHAGFIEVWLDGANERYER